MRAFPLLSACLLLLATPGARAQGGGAGEPLPAPLPVVKAPTWRPPAPPRPPRAMTASGSIEALEGGTLLLREEDGTVERFLLPAEVAVLRSRPARFRDIRPGDYIASAAAPGVDGKLHSTELRIFPDSLRGLGEGQRPMNDAREQTMTNAAVTGVVIRDDSSLLTVRFGDNVAELVVDTGVPVRRIVAARRNELTVGQKVRVAGQDLPEGPTALQIAIQ